MKPGLSVHFMVKHPPLDRMALLVEYLRPVSDEVVIIDTGSTPHAIETMASWSSAERPMHVHSEEFVDFSTTRNRGLARHTHEWTLGIDPDELPSPAMLEHIASVVHGDGKVPAWLYWTVNFFDGTRGPEMPYHWHCRLWRTGMGRLYRPIHELVELHIDGSWQGENRTRGTRWMRFAPREAVLLHSKPGDVIARDDAFYATFGAVV